jgi:hypothetical protein
MPVWFNNFPLPPSVNEYLMVIHGRLVKTKVHRDYGDLCLLWASQNRGALTSIKNWLLELKKRNETAKRPFALEISVYLAFEESRLLTVNNKTEQLDGSNRLKALMDGLSTVLSIDDKHFFAEHCEKVIAKSKETECTIIRIAPMSPRSQQEIIQMMNSQRHIRGS